MPTYADELAALDLAMPVPSLVWHFHKDDPTHPHDNPAVASCEAVYGGETYRFEIHINGSQGILWWTGRQVRDPLAHRSFFVGSQRTWEAMKTEVVARWQLYCAGSRELIAYENLAHAILVEDGMSVAPGQPAASPATATLAGIGPNSATLSHWTLAPEFAADTLAYAFPGANDAFLPVVTLGFAGQAVFWMYGDDAQEGESPSFTLVSGENIIKIIVVSQDGENVKTYKLTVTR